MAPIQLEDVMTSCFQSESVSEHKSSAFGSSKPTRTHTSQAAICSGWGRGKHLWLASAHSKWWHWVATPATWWEKSPKTPRDKSNICAGGGGAVRMTFSLSSPTLTRFRESVSLFEWTFLVVKLWSLYEFVCFLFPSFQEGVLTLFQYISYSVRRWRISTSLFDVSHLSFSRGNSRNIVFTFNISKKTNGSRFDHLASSRKNKKFG